MRLRRLLVPVHVLLFLAPVAATMSPGLCLADELTGVVVRCHPVPGYCLRVRSRPPTLAIVDYLIAVTDTDLLSRLEATAARHDTVTIRGPVVDHGNGIEAIVAIEIKEVAADRPNPPPARPPTLIQELGLSIYERPNPPVRLRTRDVTLTDVAPPSPAKAAPSWDDDDDDDEEDD